MSPGRRTSCLTGRPARARARRLALALNAVSGQDVEFELNEVLKGNPQERFQAPKAADFLTPNEKRALENRDHVDDPRAEMPWMPLNMLPIGEGAVAMEERLARLQAAKATEDGRRRLKACGRSAASRPASTSARLRGPTCSAAGGAREGTMRP